MLRTQVQFTMDQARQLRAIARRQGISVGAFADREGAKDLSRRHDDHLREAYD
jgi:hypothetical protein